MKFEEASVSVRAMRLSTWLKQAKSLVILDDMWKKLSLEEVGIPQGEDNHGCKVVMTTRISDLCTQMDVQASIEVSVLQENESWELFCLNTSEDVDSDKFQSFAKSIVIKCGGLPLAIIVLAKALKGKILDRWVVALEQLKNSKSKDISTALSAIRMSYEYLDSNETKFCFLLCCLFPEDHKISMGEMLMYTVGEDILEDTETLSEVKGRLFQIVDILISSSLLLKSDDSRFTMHDIVQDVAISIAWEKGNFIVKAGMGLSKWPKLKENIQRLSLMSNSISALPNQLGCERLLTLSLARNYNLQRLPDEFGLAMTALKTLDLSHTNISSLPQSLSSLTNLRTLNLGNCRLLVDVSLCGYLKDLEILILRYCNIKSLPAEFKFLTNLKLLNLDDNWELKTITPNVLSSLSSLEELYIDRFVNWETEGMEERKNACLSELSSLTSLSALHLKAQDDSLFYKDPPFHRTNLKKFKMTFTAFGYIINCSNRLSSSSSVGDIKAIPEWVRGLWGKTDGLRVKDCNQITNVIPLFHLSFNNLKNLELYDCAKIEYLIQTEEMGDKAVFMELENLHLTYLSDIKGICSSGSMPKGSLNKLKTLYMYRCHNLINIIPGRLLVNLHNLECVEVKFCDKVEVLFNLMGLQEERHVSMLSKLRGITLSHLPEFKMIWKGSYDAIPKNLKEIYLYDCRKLRYKKKSKKKKEMVDVDIKDEECVNNKCKLHMSDLLVNLYNLEIVDIRMCNKVEVLFNSKSVQEEIYTGTLSKLSLYNLSKLRMIWEESCSLTFPRNLKTIYLYGCSKLRYIFPISMAKNLQLLEKLEMRYCCKAVQMFGSEYVEDIHGNINDPHPPRVQATIQHFSNLKLIHFERCDSLKCLFSIGIARGLLRLETLEVRDCLQMVELFEECQEGGNIKVAFPRLKILYLQNLQTISRVSSQSSVIFSFPSLELLNIHACPNLMKNPFGPVYPRKLLSDFGRATFNLWEGYNLW